ncbi:MAG: hypothetical protein JW941_04230 [Candidatus Coatesbacteria bacterium]|nr:hypothetical protein [Candidatus Coatesbacteria bacterium]
MENESFGRFWQSVRSLPPIQLSFDLPQLNDLLSLIREKTPEKGVYGGSGWANYAAAYFNDCHEFFGIMRGLMKSKGRLIIVIGNSILQGVHVETDRYLSEIAYLQGFAVRGRHEVRKKRTGSSIIGSSIRHEMNRSHVNLYEAAIELEAPGD